MPRRKKSIQIDFPYSVNDVIKIDDIYNIINFIQITRQNCSFIANEIDSLTMENLFKDVSISFEKEKHELGVRYSLVPPPQIDNAEEQIIFDEELPDEMIEPGQCF